MDDSLRTSGIENIGKIYWGTHIAQLYDSVEDFVNQKNLGLFNPY